MGGCVSTIFPRRELGTPRKGSPEERTPDSDNSDNKEVPGEANGNELPDSVKIKYLPDVHSELLSDGIHRELLSNGIHSKPSPDEEHNIRVPDDAHSKPKDVKTKRRALLVGITYNNPWNKWSSLDGPHGDVDQYRDLLINTFGYTTDDIVVLKDLPEFPEQFKPTQVNMLRELKTLVSGAEPGDIFTFFYSGHSDQQDATSDTGEEDGMDEIIITSDEEIIVDNVRLHLNQSLRRVFSDMFSGPQKNSC